jgi:murein DD-endopeptidase MepM/ murein hydrolase activator NlpD
MPGIFTHKAAGRTPRKRAALVPALAVAIAVIGAPSALGQTGGSGPPGGTTTTDPTTTTTPSGQAQVFPLPAAHTYGDGFGAGRSGHTHMGQDVMAACGSPLVAVSHAKVKFVSFQKLAGNYVVLRYKKLHQDYFYAHLATASVTKGQIVEAGQPIATVGETGDATTCHLHFELWSGKWYRGGHAIDPLPFLQAWDAYS